MIKEDFEVGGFVTHKYTKESGIVTKISAKSSYIYWNNNNRVVTHMTPYKNLILRCKHEFIPLFTSKTCKYCGEER
jgi:hypothetical protein